jgi:putative CocE/NonD family hydrolase
MKRPQRSFLAIGVVTSVLFFTIFPPTSQGAENPTYQVTVEKNIAASMRDGTKLYADIYRPDTSEKVPVILIRTPYSKDLHGEDYSFPLYASRRGYAVVVQDVRGCFSSEGEFSPYIQELNDGYDSVEWAAGLPFSNGKVGMQGSSYLGAVQWQAAVMTPPHLVAIFPWCTFANARHFFFFRGTFDLSWIAWLNDRLPDIKRHHLTTGQTPPEERAGREWSAHKWEWLNFLPLKNFPLLKEYCPYYYEWLSHPDDGPFWDFANVEKRHPDVAVPAYNLTGWFDDGYGQPGAIRNFLGMRKNGKTPAAREGQKLIIGPWTHSEPTLRRAGPVDFGQEAAIDVDELVVRWFDYWLKGIDNGIIKEPPIRIFVMGENKWRYENEWPPGRAKMTVLYLTGTGPANSLYGQGQLTSKTPASNSCDTYIYDPANPVTDYFFWEQGPRDFRPIEVRNDVLVYTSAPLPQDLEVTGEIQAEIWASSSAKDTDFTVKVTDVYPGGYSQSITPPLSGVIRARYRESEKTPTFLTPGKIYKLAINSMYTSYVFKAGHRIRLWLSSSYFPHIDRNPNTGRPFGEDSEMISARQTIYRGKKYPSCVILPVILKSGDVILNPR